MKSRNRVRSFTIISLNNNRLEPYSRTHMLQEITLCRLSLPPSHLSFHLTVQYLLSQIPPSPFPCMSHSSSTHFNHLFLFLSLSFHNISPSSSPLISFLPSYPLISLSFSDLPKASWQHLRAGRILLQPLWRPATRPQHWLSVETVRTFWCCRKLFGPR